MGGWIGEHEDTEGAYSLQHQFETFCVFPDQGTNISCQKESFMNGVAKYSVSCIFAPMANTANNNKRPRKKMWANEVARQTHSNNRRRLAREASARQANELARARDDLRNASLRIKTEETNRRSNMVTNGLAPRLRAVMNSWGYNVPISLAPASTVSAYTDFEKIVVYHDNRLNSVAQDENGDIIPVSIELLRQIAAETRGLFYHEVGHLLFTIPLPTLLSMAVQNLDNPYVPLESNATMIVPTGNLVPQNLAPHWKIDSQFQTAWNALEDQRMETALVEESPQIASYLTVLITRNMLNSNSSWALIAGRRYLPDVIRTASERLWSVTGSEYSAEEISDVVYRYCSATDAPTMVECVEQMKVILSGTSVPSNIDSHNRIVAASQGNTPAEESAETIDSVGKTFSNSRPSVESQPDADKDGSNAGNNCGSDTSDDDGDSGDGSSATGADRDNDFVASYKERDNIKEALDDAVKELANDDTITNDLASMNDAYNDDDGSLPKYEGIYQNMNSELAQKAVTVADDIERAFLMATQDCAPHWETSQRRGFLEPVRYVTRQPGDMEIFRGWTDSGDPGHDLAVSLFLDVSGSMEGTGEQLGAAAWSVKSACDHLGIECDVTLFDHGGYRLWSAEERIDVGDIPSVVARGGTDPTIAFNSMLAEERPKASHLVLVLTDGDWSDRDALRNVRLPNMYSAVFYYDRWAEIPEMTTYVELSKRLGSDEAYMIGDLMHIPQAVEHMLVSML